MKQPLLHRMYSNSIFTVATDISKHLTLALNIICIYSFNILFHKHHFKDAFQFRSDHWPLSLIEGTMVPI